MFSEELAFGSLSVMSALQRRVSTVRTWPMCLCEDFGKITESSNTTKENCHFTVVRLTFIVR